MSRIGEYIKHLPAAIKDPLPILEAIVNRVKEEFGTLPEEKKEEIIRRRVICKGCPYMSGNAITSPEYKELTGIHYSTDRKGDHCTFCGCDVELRTASLAKPCGIATWNKNHKDRQLPLKWNTYGSVSD